MTTRPSGRVRAPRNALALVLACAVAILLVCARSLAPTQAWADEVGPEAAAGVQAEADGTSAPALASADELGEQLDSFLAGSDAGWGSLTVLVTQGGQPVLARTYARTSDGVSSQDGDTGQAYDWGRTSDLLVWCAVMQLVQQGSLSLETRVALRLPSDVSLPNGCASLTILDLMNHTSGLSASPKSLSAVEERSGDSVSSFLRDLTLTVQAAPGSIVSYSPADAALAAAVVEQVSGQSIGDYLRANITEPLGMDDTTVTVGSALPRAGDADDATARAAQALASGHGGDASGVVQGFLGNSVVSCVGTASDFARLEGALLGLTADDESPVLTRRSSETLFTVSRTFPGLGTPRVAHGMFVLPLACDAFGMRGSTWSGFSACAYMRASDEVGVVVLTDEAWRDDLTVGLARVVFGHAEVDGVAAALSQAGGEGPGTADVSVWAGTYQDSSLPTHGPAKILSALARVVVSTRAHADGRTTLEADDGPLSGVGLGVYLDGRVQDQDAYRFHVALTGGVSYSRVESDALVVPVSTLALEGCLLVGAAVAAVCAAAYVLAGAASLARARLARAAWGGQGAVLLLAALTLASVTWTFAVLAWPDTSAALSLFPAVRWANLAYVLVACVLEVWLFVTRWRGTQRAPRPLAACVLVMGCALATMLNLVYWEMLP